MVPPPRLLDEVARLEALRRYRLLDTLPEPAFDELTVLVAKLCEAPIALITLIDEERQWFKSHVGLSLCESSRAISFCGHTILQREVFVVADALQDERFADNPFVTGEPHIRFYAGAPLLTAEGQAIGSLSIIDRVPRRLSLLHEETLRVMSRQVMSQLESRRQAMELVERDADLKVTLDAARMVAFQWDMPRNCIVCSSGYENMWGFGPGEFDGTPEAFYRRIHSADLPRVESEVTRCIAQREPFGLEYRIVWPNGRVRWIRALGEFTFDPGGKPLRMRGVMAETTEQKEKVEALRQSEANYRALFESASDGIMIMDARGRYLAVNEASCEMLGYTRKELLQLSHTNIVSESEANRLALELATLKAGAVMRGEWECRRKDGTLFPVEVSATVLDDGRLLAIGRDVTQHRKAERRIQQLHRTLSMLSDINQLIVRERDGQALLTAACEITVEKGHFCLAWIGLTEAGTGRLRIVAQAGATDDTQQILHRLVSGERPDCAFTFRALQTGNHGICNDIANDPQAATWRDVALHLDYHAMASLPLKAGEQVIGTFNIYANEPDFFNHEELRLLDELAIDVSFAMEVQRKEAKRHQIEQALRESEASLAAAQALAHLGSWELDLEKLTGSWSAEQSRLYGRDPALAPPTFAEYLELVHPEDQAKMKELHTRLSERVGPVQLEHRTNPMRGSVRYFLSTIQIVRDASDRAVKITGTTIDITGRKQAELKVQHLNRTLAMLSDINQTIVREKNQQVVLTAACRIAVEKGDFRMAWVGLVDPVTQELQPIASSGAVEGYTDLVRINLRDETQSNGPAGRCIRSGEHAICNDIVHDQFYQPWREEALRRGYQSSGGFPLKIEGKVIGVFSLYAATADFFNEEELHLLDDLSMNLSFALEIFARETERQKAEAELRWKTAFFEAQVDSALDGILVVDHRGMKILQNQRMTELWKLPPHIVENKDTAVQIQFVANSTTNPKEFVEKIAYLYAHPDMSSRDVIELVDGTVLDRTSAPVKDKSGKSYGRIWTFHDITEQRELEEQLRQSQKMEAVGQLAGGVAHDFNNLLTVIHGYASMLLIPGDSPDSTHDAVVQIVQAAERAANLTRQLLAFSRRQVMQLRLLDLNEVVTSLTKMLQRILGEDIHLQLNLHTRSLMIRADAGMLDQVLLNLVVNARDAMPDGGQLFIETRERVVSGQEGATNPDVGLGHYVCLRVTDTGSGIAPEIVSRLFEPFFTTKEVGKGTGLGLATVFGIVKQHGGSITVKSDVGKGTTFQVLLPAVDEASQSREKIEPKHGARGGTETILLVEDEPAVRRLTRIVFERAGYRVLEAANGIEAMRLAEQQKEKIHLLFTDIVMPEGIGGRDLAARLQERESALRVIFTSGYSADIAGRNLTLLTGQNFIQKPAPPEQLMEIVRRCLDG